MSHAIGERVGRSTENPPQALGHVLKLTFLCAFAASLLFATKADAQCVGGAPDGNADVTEDCDDGNTSTGDGCDNSCDVEANWSAANAISFSTAALSINDYPGSAAAWTFAADNSWALQTVNTSAPTVGLFGVDAMRGTYALELEVETTGDDDFIGIVLGFVDGDPANASADYLLIDWKQGDQNAFGGFGAEGLAVSHVQGIPSTGSFWAHNCPTASACVTELARAADLGDTGWGDNTPHTFHVTYRADRLLVMVDGFIQFDISPADFPGEFVGDVFPAGEIGFYSFSQSQSATRNIATIGASVLNTTTVSDGEVYAPTGIGTTTVNISDFFSDSDDALNPNMILVTGVTGAASADDPTGGAAPGTIDVTPDDDSVVADYLVTYTACDDHPIVPHCDTATITVHYVPPVCGNGVVEPGEGCDDFNTTGGDGCDGSCLIELYESCTAGAECASGVCDTLDSNTCEQANACGNSILDTGDGEACDDGNLTANDGCNGSCLKELNESCTASGECASTVCDTVGSNTCEPALDCGNGLIETGEACDDGAAADGDGCSSLCLLEEGSVCTLAAQCATGLCDVGGLGCVFCFDDQIGTAVDSGCGGVAPYCDASGVFPFCIAACSDDGSGEVDPGCSGADNACDVSGSNPVCVDCTETLDCTIGDACNVATNLCVGGCFVDADCRVAETSVCDTSESTPGACVTCINDQTGVTPDEGCTNPALPICNGAEGVAGTACVFCLDDMSGTNLDTGCTDSVAALCDTAVNGGACVQCLSDEDCPGFQVCTVDQVCDYPDTDGDGLTDNVDTDDDGDGVPDTEEGDGTDFSFDTDADGVPDYADPEAVTCDDADPDPDGICDALPETVDLDQDGVPNHLDLDSDGDGVPDATEGHDANGDGIPDAVPAGNDDDGDGLDDAFDPDCSGMPGTCAADGLPAAVQDLDGDGSPDYLDADSDNDGLLDRVEAFDGNGDGVPEAIPSGVDADGNGLDDAFDVAQGGIGTTGQDTDMDGRPDYLDQDSDGDGIADALECADPTACPDTDGDGTPDVLDVDSDDDGIPDSIEGHDGDADGVPDFEPLGMDTDGDGLDDAYDLDMAGGVPATLPDRDEDGVPDFRDTDDDGDGVGSAFECTDVMAGCPDEDGDGVPDYLDADQSPVDTDGDGIPDLVECDGDVPSCRDSDGDGTPDYQDPDDDGDGVPTAVECTTSPDACDSDADGLPDHRDIDSDDDGIVDSVECEETPVCEDTDGDGTPDILDLDSDGDGIVDAIEGHDADMNGVPDAVAADEDGDGDGLDDAFDPDNGGVSAPTQDTDADSVPDFRDADDDGDGIDTVFECADPGAGCPDGDGDFAPDYLDVDTVAADTDGDGIPDVVECPPPGDPVGDPLGCPDSDGDMSPDFNDPDDDNDGVNTADENYDGDNDPTNQDSDGDGTPDYLDTDDDDDGLPTLDECTDALAGCEDSDGDGAPDYLDVCGDDTVSLLDIGSGWEECDDGNAVDGDGCDSTCRLETDIPDTDGDGLLDDEECPPPGNPLQPSSCRDTDGDGTPDFEDSDDDNDGIETRDETPDGDSDPRDDDTDGDGTPNYLDPDDDGDGIDTAVERDDAEALGNDDVDEDGDVNWLDTDSDGDGIADADEPGDADENGVPDYLEPLGDALARSGLIVQGGRPIGCHVGMVSQGGPASALLLVLTLCLGIRRYWRN